MQMSKYNTSGHGRGTANTWTCAWAPNDLVGDDDDAKIFFISDISHLIKKACTHVEKSSKVR